MKTNTLEENLFCRWLCAVSDGGREYDLMSDTNAVPAPRQEDQSDAIIGTKSPLGNVELSFRPQNTVSPLSSVSKVPHKGPRLTKDNPFQIS